MTNIDKQTIHISYEYCRSERFLLNSDSKIGVNVFSIRAREQVNEVSALRALANGDWNQFVACASGVRAIP